MCHCLINTQKYLRILSNRGQYIMSTPNLPDGLGNWELIWNDEFNKFNKDKWRTEQIMPDFQGNKGQQSQHQTNTFGFDNEGNRKDGASPDGKRHALWYNKHHDKTLKVRDGAMIMGAYKSDERDPSIKDSHHPYTHPQNGLVADFRNKIYTGWIDTYAMSWHDGALRPARQDSPNFYFRYGVAEFCVNFEKTQVSGLRQSGWLLPAVDPADEDRSLVGGTYDSSAANGLECDVWEYEGDGNTGGDRKNFLLCKNIGANAKNIPPVDCRKFGIKIYEGDHTISVRWTDKGTWWYVDGIEVANDLQAVVKIAMGLYMTREGNSAVGGGDGAPSDPPYRQNDHGLWGRNVGTESKEAIDADETAIKYVRVYQDKNQRDSWIAPNWRKGEGVEATDGTVTSAPKAPKVQPKTVAVTPNNPEFNIKLEGGTLSWSKTHDEDTYDIKFNNNEYKASVTGTTFEIPDHYLDGDYYVTATPSSKKFVDSGVVFFSRLGVKTPAVEPVVVKFDVAEPVVESKTPVNEAFADVDAETTDAEDDNKTIFAQITALLVQLFGLFKKLK